MLFRLSQRTRFCAHKRNAVCVGVLIVLLLLSLCIQYANFSVIPTHLTIHGKTDGFGAQYLAIMSGIAYCVSKQLVYVHTPFKVMEHGVDVAAMNTFVGIPSGPHKFNKAVSLNTTIWEPFTNYTQPSVKRRELVEQVHYGASPSLFYTSKVRRMLQTYYYNSPKPQLKIGVAIHIRRGDVDQSSGWRFTSNETYMNCISAIEAQYPHLNIHIYSEGHPDDFTGLRATLYLNTDIQETFHSLVCAQVLVMSKSTFSYTSAILNDNIVYYMDFCHKKLDHWKQFEELLVT